MIHNRLGGMMTDTDFNTVTMARLYTDQGYYDKAAEVYRCLLRQSPWREDLAQALDEVETKLASVTPDPLESSDTQPKTGRDLEGLLEEFSDWLIQYRQVRDLKKMKHKFTP